jgi:hypothetical protein
VYNISANPREVIFDLAGSRGFDYHTGGMFQGIPPGYRGNYSGRLFRRKAGFYPTVFTGGRFGIGYGSGGTGAIEELNRSELNER